MLGGGLAVWHPPPVRRLRYFAYLAFALAAFAFWMLFITLVLGMWPVPADPPCSLEPGGCPPQSVWSQLGRLVLIAGIVPLTVLLFFVFRRWVRAKVGLEDR